MLRCARIHPVTTRIVHESQVVVPESLNVKGILASCHSTALEPEVCAAPSGSSGSAGGVAGDDALSRYDDNRNGAITCAEARRHGIAPVPRSHPAYRYMRDADGDGVVCE